MSATSNGVRELEAVARAAWPPAEVVALDGWWLCADRGHTRRANSAHAERSGALLLDEKLERVDAFYAERGLRPCIKTCASPMADGLEAELEARGYAPEGSTRVQTVAIDDVARPDADVHIRTAPEARWRDAWVRLDAASAGRAEAVCGIHARVAPPKAFASIEEDGEVVAVGYTACAPPHAGLASLITDPARRGRRLGERVTRALMHWAAGRGARVAYLQVEADNAAGLRLYERLGYADAYRYTYWCKA